MIYKADPKADITYTEMHYYTTKTIHLLLPFSRPQNGGGGVGRKAFIRRGRAYIFIVDDKSGAYSSWGWGANSRIYDRYMTKAFFIRLNNTVGEYFTELRETGDEQGIRHFITGLANSVNR